MPTARSGLLLLAMWSGCATADHATASDASTHDAPRSDAHVDGHSGACAMAFSGALATYDFTGTTGSQTTTAASATAPGITAGDISRAAGLTAASGATSINASGWPTAAQLDPTKYYTLSITPPAGCSLDVTSLTADVKSSGTGPASAAVATSADAFAQTTAVSTTAPSTPTVSVSGASGSVEIRIYGFSATGGTGTMRVQNTLRVTGALR